MIKILFICHGNICRSPMAEYVMKKFVKEENLSEKIHIESAATSTEEIGNPIYPPVVNLLVKNGIDCSQKRARRVTKDDYNKFDLCKDTIHM